MYNLGMDGQDTVQVEGKRLEAKEVTTAEVVSGEGTWGSGKEEVVSGEESQVPQVDQAPAVVPGEVPIVSELVATPVNNTEAVIAEEAPVAPEAVVTVEPEIVADSSKAEVVSGEDGVSSKEKVVSGKEVPKTTEHEENHEEASKEIGKAEEVKRDPMEIAKALDHDVLEAAFRLLARERSATLLDAKRKSDKKKVDENSDRVEKFVAQYKKGVRRTTIADKLNMSPSKVTDYLQRLIASGRVRAEGKTNDRRFYIS